MLKSVREARQRTNWSVPRTEYEDAVSSFVRRAMASAPFLGAFSTFEGEVAAAGAQNGLIETALKLTVPGVPDIYQGADLWEQSMVDPDNRRPVDFEYRASGLASEPNLLSLLPTWRDGRIKQQLIAKLLELRKVHPSLFRDGSYEPMEAGDAICAFARSAALARINSGTRRIVSDSRHRPAYRASTSSRSGQAFGT